jgi:hypothetical protein
MVFDFCITFFEDNFWGYKQLKIAAGEAAY